MPRSQRISIPSAFYHVMLRGNDSQNIFFNNQDRLKFCSLLKEGIEHYHHSIHGFCLMSNHVHLVIQLASIPISTIIQHLAASYARHINFHQDKKGHLFQGRFKSILIDEETYLNQLIRYVHLNPVRAGLVTWPENYQWSSHRTYLGLKETSWISQAHILQNIHPDISTARKLFKEFVNIGIGVDVSLEFKEIINQGMKVGKKAPTENTLNKDSLVLQKISIKDLIEATLKATGLSLVELISTRKAANIRGILAFLVKEFSHLTIANLAVELNKDRSVLSRSALTIEPQMQMDEELAYLIKVIKEKLTDRIK